LESKERTLAELGAILRTQRAVRDLGGSGSELEAQFGKATNRFRRIGSTARAHSDNLSDAIRGYEVINSQPIFEYIFVANFLIGMAT
jgi:hypothetical protein